MTYRDLANIYLAVYNQAPDPGWDLWIDGDDTLGVKDFGAFTAIFHRGSETPEDWKNDFDALPVWDDKLGEVHPGALLGTREAWAKVKVTFPDWKNRKWVVGGHSLGAMHGNINTVEMIQDGCYPPLLLTWGEPLCVGQKGYNQISFARFHYGLTKFSLYNYKNILLKDIVPDAVPPLGYMRTGGPLTKFCSEPAGQEVLDPHAWHSMKRYADNTPEIEVQV